jgi:hypothetical protein
MGSFFSEIKKETVRQSLHYNFKMIFRYSTDNFCT